MTSPKRLEALLFDQRTTTKTDFRGHEIRNWPKTEYKLKPPPKCPTHEPLKHNHTLGPVRNHIPFDLYIHGDPVLQHDPRKPVEFQPYPVDEQREEIQKTRPRVIMSPQVSVDDIECPTKRDVILKETYTTEWMIKSQQAIMPAGSHFKVVAPMTPLPAPARPTRLHKPDLPYISPEWRWDAVTWDWKQSREYCEPTKTFWLNQPYTRYSS